jgi:hypothetical protein
MLSEGGAMNKVDGALRRASHEDADAELEIIVHTDDAQARLPSLKEQGLRVRHVIGLTQTVAGTCRAGNVDDLAQLPFVRRIELDRPVRATRR